MVRPVQRDAELQGLLEVVRAEARVSLVNPAGALQGRFFAAQAVVEAAGGMVTDTQMQPLRYNTKESLLNPHFLVFGDRSENWGRFV